MKKGLLSLLALALTVVGCQNYDDQFDELTSQITSLQSTVDGLTGVTQSIATLQSTVAAISSAITSGNAANAAANQATAASLATVSQTLADLQASLGNVAQAGDLDAISSTLAEVQADVRELLEANAVINQDITINNAATLEYVETLIATGDDDPNVIVNGKVTIDTDALTADEKTRANAVAAKLATILGDGAGDAGLDVDSDAAVTFTNLAFVDDDVTFDGSAQDIPALRTISGELTTNYAGPQNFQDLTSVGTLTITNNASATSVNLSGVDVDAIITGTAAAGILTLNNAGSIDLGTAPFTQLTANAATSVNADMDAITTLTVTATAATAIDFNSAESATGDISITGTSTTIIHMDALEQAAAITVSDSGQSHFGALESASGVIDVTADSASDFSSLEDLAAAATIGGASVNLSALAANTTGTLELPDATTANLTLLVASNNVTATDATEVTLVEIETGVDLSAPAATSLTLSAQEDNFTIAAATEFPSLATLNVTGKDVTGVTGFELSVTALTTLTTVNAGGEIGTLTVSGTGPETVVTSGNITDLILTGSSIDDLTLGHTFISGDTAVTMEIINTDLVSIDMSNVTKVKRLTVTGNASLTTVVGPSSTTLPEAGATISATFSGNDLAAAYTAGSSPTAATETTPAVAAVEPVITSASVASILGWWNAAAANADSGVSTEVSIDIENVEFDSTSAGADGDINAAFADDDYASETSPAYAGVINAAHEVAACTAE